MSPTVETSEWKSTEKSVQQYDSMLIYSRFYPIWIKDQWRIQDFLEEDEPNPKLTYYFGHFSRKPHKNEETWTVVSKILLCRSATDQARFLRLENLLDLSDQPDQNSLLPPSTKLGQGNIFSSVCQEFCSQEVGSTWAVHPLDRSTLRAGTPPGQVHPQAGTPPAGIPPGQVYPLGRYTLWAGTSPRQVHTPRQVHPPGRYTLAGTLPGQLHPLAGKPPGRYPPPGAVHAGRYWQQVGGTHPTAMHSCFASADRHLEHLLDG